MTSKQIRKWFPVIVATLLLLVLCGYTVYLGLGDYYADGTGSMAEARRLRPLVEAMPAPTTTTKDQEANTLGIVFPNGEWVIGVAKDSHGKYARLTGGGTVVLKDSRGRVRCFFGHVCGGGHIMQDAPTANTLDGLDIILSRHFTEQTWP